MKLHRQVLFMAAVIFASTMVVSTSNTATPRNVQAEASTCTALPSLEATWDRLRKGRATGMMVFQNDEIVFEEYSRGNICSGCGLDFVYNLLDLFYHYQSGGSSKDVYSMASQTKSLAGLATVLLMKQNRLSLDDFVSTYIPEWQDDPDKSTITIRDLLTLSSGIETSNQLVSWISLEETIASPFEGAKWSYGSQPFTLISYIVQQITGMSTNDFLQAELLTPLGVSTMNFKSLEDGSSVTEMAASGRVTLPDMIKIGVEVMNAAHNKGSILDSDDISLMVDTVSPFQESYGLTIWRNAEVLIGPVTRPVPVPNCGPGEVFHFLGIGGQALTIVPKKRLVVAVSQHFSTRSLLRAPGGTEFFDVLFEDIGCECIVEVEDQ